MNKLVWSGLADNAYYNGIAKYCLPSWSQLPGNKYVVHDADSVQINGITVVDWKLVPNNGSNFLKINPSRKTWNFWRKMQSQVWAVRNLAQDNDFLILLDTDIEVTVFDIELFDQELDQLKQSGHAWATGQDQTGKLDAGVIVINLKHSDVNQLINYYEQIWETDQIFQLPQGYDGDAVESMLKVFPSYKIKNTNLGRGLHVYDIGLVHFGSKIPKALRATHTGPVAELLENLPPVLFGTGNQ